MLYALKPTVRSAEATHSECRPAIGLGRVTHCAAVKSGAHCSANEIAAATLGGSAGDRGIALDQAGVSGDPDKPRSKPSIRGGRLGSSFRSAIGAEIDP